MYFVSTIVKSAFVDSTSDWSCCDIACLVVLADLDLEGRVSRDSMMNLRRSPGRAECQPGRLVNKEELFQTVENTRKLS